ncbi:MAG TPA: ABC transporter permease [Candidatus Acidoferrales bacterium]|nr:ABC transporter permease [Candidatus Acidoferrales bacterium]
MFDDFRLRMRSLFKKHAVDSEVSDELRFHFDQQVEKLIASGVPLDEARRRARLALGTQDEIHEQFRDASGVRFVESLLQDIRFAFRMLRKSPGFTAVAVLTLALGIGANTAIFSVLEAQIWKSLPFPDSKHLLFVGRTDAKHPDRTFMMSAADYQDWLAAAQNTFASICAFQGSDYYNTPGTETAEMVRARPVSASFFETLRMPPAIGRAFLPDEQQEGRDHEVILSDAYWQRRYASNPKIIGQSLVLDGAPYIVVGVAPAGLRFEFYGDPDMYVPLSHKNSAGRDGSGLTIVAREKPGVALSLAQAQMDVIAKQLASQHPQENSNRGIKLQTLQEAFDGPHQGLFFFAGAAALVLLVACANIASLLLARGLARRHEFAIRSALGARRSTLLRQLLIEGALLGVIGGAFGVLVAFWSAGTLNSLLPSDFVSRKVAPQLDLRVLLFAVAISLAASISAALAPGLFASRVNLTDALQSARGLSGPPANRRLRSILVIAEVTLAVALLFGAGLFLNSFVRQVRAPLGFDPHNLLSLGLTFSDKHYAQPQNLWLAEQQILERVRAVPGVKDAMFASQIPLASGIDVQFNIAGQPVLPVDERPSGLFSSVTFNYFHLFKIPLLAGREFDANDTASAPIAAVVDETFATDYFAGKNPIGSALDIFAPSTLNNRLQVRIVGIVQNAHVFGPNEVPFDFIYVSAAQVPITSMNDSVFLVASTEMRGSAVLDSIRHQISQVGRNIPVTHIATMDERVDESLKDARGNMILIGIFAGLAAALVAVGIFGAIAYFVEQRTREFGIRLALGATPGGILLSALKHSARLGLAGIGCGVALSLALGRLLGSALYLVPHKHDGLLYGVSMFDPLTLIAACVLLAGVLFAASWVPARRAMKVDPMIALRYE